MVKTGLHIKLLSALSIFVLISQVAASQCPTVFDFYGAPSSNPYWYSCTGNNFSFNLQSPNAWNGYTVDWGDGTPMTSGATWTSPTPLNHIYTAVVDTFVVTITETSSGCVITGVVVMEEATSASIQIPVGGLTQACAPQTMEFINSSTNVSETTIFTWDFGDGSAPLVFDYTNWNQTIAHTYEVGTVDCETVVSLTAENYCNTIQGGESEATFNPIRIWDLDDPGITASATLLCYPDTTVTFLNTTERNCFFQGNIYQRYEYWNFGDYWGLGQDSIIDWTPWPPTFPHTMHYPGIGTYTVELLDSNFCGIAPTSITIQIVPPPVAGIGASTDTVCVGEPITFYQQSTGGGNAWAWNFGTGFGWIPTGNGNVTYTFNTPGTYTVQTRAQITGSSSNCSDIASITVVVLPRPVVTLTANPIHGCDELDVAYNATSNDAVQWDWNFEVNPFTHSGQLPPIIHYDQPGVYTTGLVVTGLNGCTKSTEIDVFVHPSVQVSFTVFNLCEGEVANFTNTSDLFGESTLSRLWDFGDGETSTENNPQHLYAAPGTYSVTLTVNTNYCSDTYSMNVVVEPAPDALPTVDITNGCSPLHVQFGHQTVGAVSYLWQFGDGTTSTEENPSHIFYNAGSDDETFNVSLTVYNAFGCGTTENMLITVYPGSIAAFDDNSYVPGCSPLATQFTNLSQNASSYLWDFGDGNSSILEDPSHVYINTTGFVMTYNISLVAYNGNGCHDTISQPIVVYPQAIFDFTISPDSGCAPLSVTMPFIAGVQMHNWNFGDGITSTAAVPTHLFQNNTLDPVPYTVTLVGVSPFGCADTATSVITVNPSPIAQFTASISSGCSPLAVDFTNLSMNADSYTWQYGDGTTSTESAVTHSYTFVNNTPNIQTFPVVLTAHSDDGCSQIFTVNISVFPQVVAAFNHPTNICSGTTVYFDNISLNANQNTWVLGNGLQSADENPSSYYAVDGIDAATYTIELFVSSTYGCTDSTSSVLTVNPSPVADFSLNNQQACEPAPVFITNESQNATSYAWNYGDGTMSIISDIDHIHTFQDPGNTVMGYTMTLTAYTSQGCVDTASAYFTMYPEVMANFGVDTIGCSPFNAAFFNQSIGATSFEWQFGDGSISDENNPSHVYLTNNTDDVSYEAFLISENIYGCTDTAQHTIYVNHTPVAIAQLDGTSGCYPLEAFFFNGSIGADTYQWVYGTGETSTIADEIHQQVFYNYTSNPITYNIQLHASTMNGCVHSDNLLLEVSPQIEADFDYFVTGCSPVSVLFNNNSEGAFTYQWNFGDGDVSNASDPTHNYFNFGTTDTSYHAQLVIFNTFGCSDTMDVTIPVGAMPNAAFTVTPTEQMWPNATFAIDNTSAPMSMNFSWDMNDGTDLYVAEPGNYTYSNWGTYSIRLIANSGLCADTAFQTVTIYPPAPIVDFIGPAEGCAPLTVQFTNQSQYIVQSHWLFGDGGEANATNPVYTYTTPGAYSVTLIGMGVDGSTTQITEEYIIHVYPSATAAFIVAPNEVNIPSQPVYCLNLSQNATIYNWDFGDGYFSSEENPIHYYEEEGVYSVQLIANNEFNCPDTMLVVDAVHATASGMIKYPNAFTPNTSGGNGGAYDVMSYDNDVFFPLHSGVDEYELQIFNKWGELLFESTDVNKGWDGYYRGHLCKQDVYVWKVRARFVDGQQYVNAGDVTLLIK